MTSKHNKTVLLHTNDFKECWNGKFFLPGAKKPFTGTVEISSDTNPFHLNRRLTQRLNFKNGGLNGVREWFYKNGILRSRFHYRDDEHHGVCEHFYKNGKLR